jgi:hypothetical protein
MKGAVVDAMAVAIDGADAMLSCVTLAYKESANCRMEAQYGHQQSVDMIPLVRQLALLQGRGLSVLVLRAICAKPRCCTLLQMMQQNYRPTGWLGLLLGTKVYFSFHPAAIKTEAAFMQQIDAVARDLGERGKAKLSRPAAAAAAAAHVAEGVPPTGWSAASAPAAAASVTMSPPARTPERSFTPSMQQLSSPVAATGRTADEGSSAALVEAVLSQQRLILQREEQLRAEMEARMRAEARLEASGLRDLHALQRRLESLHSAGLLSDEELHAIQDTIADGTTDGGQQQVDDVAAMVSLSATMAAHDAFARQLRRKFT